VRSGPSQRRPRPRWSAALRERPPAVRRRGRPEVRRLGWARGPGLARGAPAPARVFRGRGWGRPPFGRAPPPQSTGAGWYDRTRRYPKDIRRARGRAAARVMAESKRGARRRAPPNGVGAAQVMGVRSDTGATLHGSGPWTDGAAAASAAPRRMLAHLLRLRQHHAPHTRPPCPSFPPLPHPHVPGAARSSQVGRARGAVPLGWPTLGLRPRSWHSLSRDCKPRLRGLRAG
jgi:hypothetical protein